MTNELKPLEGDIENPFPIDERLNVGTVTIEAERAIAQVKAAITMAQACPRNKHSAMEKILENCRRLEFAKEALYSYPRGGETISGLSIRAAEMIATAWGNIEFGLMELSQSNGESEMLAFAWDLESNTRSTQSFRFRHERHKRNGIVDKLTDPRDIYETGANLAARRMRSRILSVIDPDVKKAAEVQCRLTVTNSVSNKKTLTERTDELVKEFGKAGIKVAHIEKRLGHKISEILPDEYADLANIYNSLKDKMTQPSDWFAVPKAQGGTEQTQKLESLLSGENGEVPEEQLPDGVGVNEE